MPTRPELKIRKLNGLPVAKNLTERDQLSEEFIPFYLTFDEDSETVNCFENPEACVSSFIFEGMGVVENQGSASNPVARKKRSSSDAECSGNINFGCLND